MAVLVIQNQNGNQIAQNQPGNSEKIVQASINQGGTLANKIQTPTPHQQFEIKRSDLSTAKVGDVIEAVSANGGAVSVIRLTVVDRQAGVEALRVLLSGEGQVKIQGAETDGANGLVTVNLPSDPQQMAAALKQVGDKLDFESLRELQSAIAEKESAKSDTTASAKTSVRVIFVLVNDAKPAAKPAAKDASGAAD